MHLEMFAWENTWANCFDNDAAIFLNIFTFGAGYTSHRSTLGLREKNVSSRASPNLQHDRPQQFLLGI